MTPKENLLDLIHEFGLCGYQINDLADYLLANDVVVLSCRCKECESYNEDLKRCTHPQWAATEYGVWEQDFCSYGERKDEDEDGKIH